MQRPVVCGLQLNPAWEDAAANRARVEAMARARPPAAGSLVALPELFTSGFTMNVDSVAEAEGGPTERFLSETAVVHGIWLLAGIPVRTTDGGAANEAVVFAPDGCLTTRYRKQRPFAPGDEHRHYVAGTAPAFFRWGEVGVCPFICYDLRFPELFRAATARWRPELFVVVASWPDRRIQHWLKLLQARAIEGQGYVLGVNRVGDDPTHHHTGRSVIVDPWGEILADAGEDEGWIEAELDLAALRDYRRKLPFLDDLRP